VTPPRSSQGAACAMSATATRAFLQAEFVKQAKWSRQHGHFVVFLELYAGSEGVSKAIRRAGYGCVAFEISRGSQYDLLRPVVDDMIRGWISSGCVAGIMLGTPCSSWSLARRGPVGSGWAPLRSPFHIMGLPGLSAVDAARVTLGNRTMAQSARVIRTARKHGVPVVLENPFTSRLFLAPPVRRLASGPDFHRWCFDQCQFGAPWRKRTALWGWGVGHETQRLDARCAGRKGVCSRSKCPHISLQGRAPGNKLWTAIAQAYPPPLAKTLAELLIHAFQAKRMVAGLSRL